MDIVDGWFTCAKKIDSPNCNDRPQGCEISLLVVHNISLPPGQYGGDYIDQLFTNVLSPDDDPYFACICEVTVSSHFLIDRHGQITQYVDLSRRAWHAGVSSFLGRENCNDYSIGIELEGEDRVPYTSAQYRALADLALAIMEEYPAINPDRIVGHSDIAPERKSDPGPSFDWVHFLSMLSDGGEHG